MLSHFFSIFYSSEEHMLRNQAGGVFIGRSEELSIPFMLGQENLMNPHIFIAGATGSGKSFLMRSLIMKSICTLNVRVLVLDMTGEYSDIASYFFAESPDPEGFLIGEGKLAYYDLSKLKEDEKVGRARSLLDGIVNGARRRGTERGDFVMVFFDEAWKLLQDSMMLDVLIREGRKYKVGVAIASQLIEDVESSMLSNVATLFLFRIQNRKSLDIIKKNYFADEQKIRKLQELGQGSCMVIQIYKDKSLSSFFLSRVVGVSMPRLLRISNSGKMIEVSERDLRRALDFIGCESSRVLGKISGDEISMGDFLDLLAANNLDKRKILKVLRLIGIDDDTIADSFALKISGANGKE